jgi:death-on-curing protein
MRYLSVEEILLIHEFELQRYGGLLGIRSIELLESSVQRPQTRYGGKELFNTPFEKAASLIHSIIANRPFMDGNKRTALVSGTVFLRLNGYTLNLSQKEFVKIALDVTNRTVELEDLAKVLRRTVG